MKGSSNRSDTIKINPKVVQDVQVPLDHPSSTFGVSNGLEMYTVRRFKVGEKTKKNLQKNTGKKFRENKNWPASCDPVAPQRETAATLTDLLQQQTQSSRLLLVAAGTPSKRDEQKRVFLAAKKKGGTNEKSDPSTI